jgi:hypothetical protein
MFSNGSNDQAYEYTPGTKLTNAIINNPIDSTLAIGEHPSTFVDNWTNNETNSVTPVVDFATTGDFVPSYTTRNMEERRVGNVVFFNVGLIFDTNAFTTASGDFSIGGFTYAAASLGTFSQQTIEIGPFSNVTLGAGRSFEAFVTGTTIQFRRSVSAGPHSAVGVTNILPSTTGIELNVSGQYFV